MDVTEPTIRQLRDLVERALRDRPHLTSRLEKAAFLVLLRSVVPHSPNHYQIGSEDGLRFYEVINGHCECSDYVRHGPGHPRKHRLAVELPPEAGRQLNAVTRRPERADSRLSYRGAGHELGRVALGGLGRLRGSVATRIFVSGETTAASTSLARILGCRTGFAH